MFILLAIIIIVLIALAAYFLQVHGKEEYNYSILSAGGLGVSFLGAIAFVVSYYYYSNHINPVGMVVAIIIGCIPYIMMLVRDSKKMTIPLAIASGLLRFAISALLVMAILCYCMKGTSSKKE